MPSSDRAAKKALGTLQAESAQTQRLRGGVSTPTFTVAAGATVDYLLRVSGPIPRDTVSVSPVDNLPAGVVIGATKVPEPGQIAVRLFNSTGSDAAIPAGVWRYSLERRPPNFGG